MMTVTLRSQTVALDHGGATVTYGNTDSDNGGDLMKDGSANANSSQVGNGEHHSLKVTLPQ